MKGDNTMSNNIILAKIEELKDLEAMQSELSTLIDNIKDELKAEMTERQTEELEAGQYIIRWTTILSNRFDSTAFKKVMPDVYKAYTKQVSSKRFTISD